MATNNISNVWDDITAKFPTLDRMSSAYNNIKNSELVKKYSDELQSVDLNGLKTSMANLSNDVAHAAGVGVQAATDKTKEFIEKYDIGNKISNVLPDGVNVSKFKDVFSSFSAQVKESMDKAAESETVKAVTTSPVFKDTMGKIKGVTESPNVQNAIKTVRNGAESLKRSFLNGRNDYSNAQEAASADGPEIG